MKTVIITPDLFQSEGGIARILRLYLKAVCELTNTGGEVGCAVLNEYGDDELPARAYAGTMLARLDNCERSKLVFFLLTLWRGRSVDRLICGHLHHLILARFAAVFNSRLKYYLIAHGIEVWRPYTFLERAALRGAYKIFCVSEYTRRQMLRFDAELAPSRLVVLPNTFDPGFESIREMSLVLEGRRPRILVVSRLASQDPYKGVDTMIEAMPQILGQFPLAQLRIVGGGDDRPRLDEITRELNLSDAVHFCGLVDDTTLRKEYMACDLFALPSRKEGFGLVYLEAMVYGKPCLAARAGGAPEVITGEVGALVEYGNTDQIARAVSDLVQHPRSSTAIHAHVNNFTFPMFKRRLAAALED